MNIPTAKMRRGWTGMTSYCGLSIITVTKHDDLRLQTTKKSLRDQDEKLFEHLIISYEANLPR